VGHLDPSNTAVHERLLWLPAHALLWRRDRQIGDDVAYQAADRLRDADHAALPPADRIPIDAEPIGERLLRPASLPTEPAKL
jgi:hypothetical protein